MFNQHSGASYDQPSDSNGGKLAYSSRGSQRRASPPALTRLIVSFSSLFLTVRVFSLSLSDSSLCSECGGYEFP